VLSSELESCLNQAFHQARSAHHEFLTVEHLLLAILDTPTVREVLKGCGADLDQLGFQRVLQRAVFHVQSSGKQEVGVLDVLVAIFSEKQSHAVLLLARAQVTLLDVVNYIGQSKPLS
jgi:ATP-dependent Clp protease ATP-binding subunit ClpA